ncbi:MAG TPA: YcaO-like family protein [Polyangiaceae bacterium]|jgi:ribosomal protein S12 methylthiotransferase accessory factor|nr:YcaO-like family protein [Polyangiaceae bacterium]
MNQDTALAGFAGSSADVRAGAAATAKGIRRGTHRTVTPEETLSRVLPLARVFGISRVANITGLDTLGIPVWVACRPNARSLSVSQGKGIDDASARASAVMEAIEAFHAERIPAPIKFGSHNELRFTHSMVDVHVLPKTEPAAFHDDARIFWIEGQDLSTGEGVWLPFELVHLNYTLPALTGSGFFLGSSNGLASGNHLLEAISHGLCEAIERDAATLWALLDEWDKRATRIDLRTIEDPAACAILDRYDRADVGVALWETTADVAIPSFACTIVDRSRNAMRPVPAARGLGCHPSRDIAVLRALTEAAQSRLTVIAGSRDDLDEGTYGEPSELEERTRRTLCDETGTRRVQEAPTWENDTFEDDVRREIELLNRAGLNQVLAVDLTRPEFEIPVARVVVPGLEAFHEARGFVPGERARRVFAKRKQ